MLLALAAATAPLLAQGPARVDGSVRDSAGHPVALVRITAGAVRSLTDSAGRFSLRDLPAGSASIAVRRLGYSPVDTTLALASGRTDSLSLVLAQLPANLPGITTTEEDRLHRTLPDFFRHRSSGVGRFFLRSDIDARHPQQISDLVRLMPGWQTANERGGRTTLRSSRSARPCAPDVWVDGVRAEGLNADDIEVNDVEALELYGGPAGLPPDLNDRLGHPACGVIVIWTRLPG